MSGLNLSRIDVSRGIRRGTLGMIITIDGPAGAGKSTVARALARRLGFRFLDTGAMYRAVALAALRRGLDWDAADDLARLARKLDIRTLGKRILLDGEDVSEAVRTSEVTAVTRYAADNPRVREFLVELQRKLAGSDDVVTEGRDQGTVAFPRAECKIFLTASPAERARRRVLDLQSQGEPVTLEQVLAAQERRDREDATRAVGPLAPAADAVTVYTDGLTLEEVVARLEKLAAKK
jgi:cytidylate kinase